MAYQKKTWKNRVADYPTRRLITPVGQGDAFVAEIERNEGTITEEGDPFNAATMNDLENRIEAGIGAGNAVTAPIEATSTASTGYSVGQYLIYNNKFYKVTATIPQGASLVPGTNLEEKTVATELTWNANTNNSQATSINNLNGQLTSGNTHFYFDYKNGKWGWNSSAGRGADTFHPFKVESVPVSLGYTTNDGSTGTSGSVNADGYVMFAAFGYIDNNESRPTETLTLGGNTYTIGGDSQRNSGYRILPVTAGTSYSISASWSGPTSIRWNYYAELFFVAN